MLTVAVINNGLVVNTVAFAEEDRDLVATFDFPGLFGEGSYGVIVDDGQVVSSGYLYKDGIFSQPAPPDPTHEDQVMQASLEKQNRINSADSVFSEWQTKLILNIASESQKQAVINWVTYKDALKEIDPQDAPNITWPETPEIPE